MLLLVWWSSPLMVGIVHWDICLLLQEKVRDVRAIVF